MKETEETTFSEEKDVKGHEEESSKTAEVVGEVEGFGECKSASPSPEESSADKSEAGILIALEFD